MRGEEEEVVAVTEARVAAACRGPTEGFQRPRLRGRPARPCDRGWTGCPTGSPPPQWSARTRSDRRPHLQSNNNNTM